ncbi:hypothetical protein V6Z92_009687 [Aspergillus fumigatus]
MIDYSTLLGHVAHVQPRLVDDLSFLILIIGVLMLLIDVCRHSAAMTERLPKAIWSPTCTSWVSSTCSVYTFP